MGHCFNSLKYSGTTKQRSAQQKYQFAKIKAAHHTSDDIAKQGGTNMEKKDMGSIKNFRAPVLDLPTST